MSQLLSQVRDIREQGEDFAYFCSFDDRERLVGLETLFRTDEKPFLFRNNARSALDEGIPRLFRDTGMEDEARIPVFSSFNIVRETLGIRSRHESDWPMLGAILPSSVSSGRIVREGKTQSNPGNRDVELSGRDRNRLEGDISEIVERIREGEALQVVMSQHFELEEFNGPEVLEYLLKNDRSRYVYYYRFGSLEIIGSSPENVFRKDRNTVSINPIAGTRKRSTGSDRNLVDSLLGDNKELCEHRMLVDLARNDLSRIGKPGSVKVTRNMIPEAFYSVIHLTSTVEAEFSDENSNYSTFASLFPAGTVSGAPKVRALEIIDHYETRDRGPYGGAVGLIGKNSMDMALTIRSAFMNSGKAYTQAGAGIVKDSVPEREVDEIIAKAATIMAGGLICV